MLFYFRSEEDLSPRGAIPLRGAKVELDETHDVPFCMRISLLSPTLQPFYLRASTEEEFCDWFDVCIDVVSSWLDRDQDRPNAREVCHVLFSVGSLCDVSVRARSLHDQ